ncbi:MAG TPA: phosphotransferase [Streptosporangiaceae bacterium]|nr:phosphotransferase [Streptosporangiaceae bacterium]
MAADLSRHELIGVGRTADVYAISAARVLRRYRVPIDVRAEADVMAYLGRAGYPVPAVYDADGTDLVMERLDGGDMLADLARRPWRARRHGRTLAALHDRLHAIEAPPGLRPFGTGNRVLHLDLHPANVMLTTRGPVVIDWVNARAGTPGADVAMAYLIMASSEVDDIPASLRLTLRPVRAALIGGFRRAAHDDPGPHIAMVARERMRDRNVRPGEIERLRKLAEAAEQAASPAAGSPA